MLDAETLVFVKQSTQGGVEVWVNDSMTPDEKFWVEDTEVDTEGWVNDVEGSGLVLLFHKSKKRQWVTVSVSKTPFTYVKRGLKTISSYVTDMMIVRGEDGFPLTDKEAKTLSGLLVAESGQTVFLTSYTTIFDTTPELSETFNKVVNQVIKFGNKQGFFFKEANSDGEPSADFVTGTQVVKVDGLTVTITTELSNPDEPESGLNSISIKCVDRNNNVVLYSNAHL